VGARPPKKSRPARKEHATGAARDRASRAEAARSTQAAQSRAPAGIRSRAGGASSQTGAARREIPAPSRDLRAAPRVRIPGTLVETSLKSPRMETLSNFYGDSG
jgi:hypothetical protein